jgi:hypothetical protein
MCIWWFALRIMLYENGRVSWMQFVISLCWTTKFTELLRPSLQKLQPLVSLFSLHPSLEQGLALAMGNGKRQSARLAARQASKQVSWASTASGSLWGRRWTGWPGTGTGVRGAAPGTWNGLARTELGWC